MSNEKLTNVCFSVLSVDTVADMVEDGLDKNSILHGSAQYSDDGTTCFVAGEYETCIKYLDNGKDLYEYLEANGYTFDYDDDDEEEATDE